MTEENIEYHIDVIKKHLDKLREIKGQSDDPLSLPKRWVPKEDETVYFIAQTGDRVCCTFYEQDHDGYMFKNNELFRSEEQAKKYMAAWKKWHEIRGDWVPDWSLWEEKKYSCFYDYGAHAFKCRVSYYDKHAPDWRYMSSAEHCNRAIREIGDEGLRLLLMGER